MKVGREVVEIPVEWEVKKLGELCERIMDGTHFSPKSKNGSFLYMTSKNIKNGFIDINNAQYISENEHLKIYNKCPVKFGDVLLIKDGASTGNCAVNKLNYPFSILSSIAILRGKQSKLSNTYLFQFFMSDIGQDVIKTVIAGQAITRITLVKINKFLIPLPPLSEQKQIVDILSSVDKSIQTSQNKLEQLKQLKKGLMQDLLTGKVRVKV